jgi:hypothetical protein
MILLRKRSHILEYKKVKEFIDYEFDSYYTVQSVLSSNSQDFYINPIIDSHLVESFEPLRPMHIKFFSTLRNLFKIFKFKN